MTNNVLNIYIWAFAYRALFANKKHWFRTLKIVLMPHLTLLCPQS